VGFLRRVVDMCPDVSEGRDASFFSVNEHDSGGDLNGWEGTDMSLTGENWAQSGISELCRFLTAGP
jgi:hypothetical protein